MLERFMGRLNAAEERFMQAQIELNKVHGEVATLKYELDQLIKGEENGLFGIFK